MKNKLQLSTKIGTLPGKKKNPSSRPVVIKGLSLRAPPVVISKTEKCSTPRIEPKVITVKKP